MRTVRDIIDTLGGTSAVAKAHNPPLAISTVDSWKAANFIPEWRRPDLKRVAKDMGKPLADEDFPPKDKGLRLVD